MFDVLLLIRSDAGGGGDNPGGDTFVPVAKSVDRLRPRQISPSAGSCRNDGGVATGSIAGTLQVLASSVGLVSTPRVMG